VDWSILAPLALAEHELVVFVAIDGLDLASGPMMTFRDLIKGGCPLPSDQCDALVTRYASDPIWRMAEPDEMGKTAFALSRDLHPHIRSILSGARIDLATRWMPTETTTRLLTKADLYQKAERPGGSASGPPPGYVRKKLAVNLTPRAEQRLSAVEIAQRRLAFQISAMDLTLFETKKGLLQARVAFMPFERAVPINAMEFLEAAYALSHRASLRWVAADENHEALGDPFAFPDLLRSLCLPEWRREEAPSRNFTYSYVHFEEALAPERADAFAFYASRRYNSDYEVSEPIEDTRRVRDFATVGHTLSLEGAATVIAPLQGNALPEFLRTWRTHAFQATYLPIVTLALHEHQFLVEKTSTALLTREQRRKPSEVRRAFFDLTRASLDFRIFFRFSEVSEVSRHNALNRALREVLGLDRMLVELNGDVAEASAFLERENDRAVAQRDHLRSRRFWFFGVVGGGVIAALTTTALIKQVLEDRELFVRAVLDPIAVLNDNQGPAFFGLIAGLAVMLIAWIVGYLKRPLAYKIRTEEPRDEEANEAAIDLIVHESLEQK